MSNRRLSSPYFRYFKARLWNLARPSFWGTAIFLSVVGLTIREFWMRPDMLTSRQSESTATQPQVSSTLSAEDRAIVADIDNLSILEHDSQQGQPTSDTVEPISQPRQGNQNPLEQAVKNQNTSNDTKLDSNVNAPKAPTPSVKYDNPFLTQAQNLLQFRNPSRNGNSGFVGLNTVNSSNQFNQLSIGFNQSSTDKSTQKPVTTNSLETALNSSSLNPLQNQTSFGQLINRNQSIVQPNNFLPSSNNINTVSQGINNSTLSTQFAQPAIVSQPQTVYSNLNGANLTQPANSYGNFNSTNSTQPSNYSNLNGANLTQPANSYGNFNSTNSTQPSNYSNLNGANLAQPVNYYGNFNNTNLTQPVSYGNWNGINSTQIRTYSNFNNNNNNFNNIPNLPNSNFTPQSAINTTPTTVTPNISNSVTYPSAITSTPSSTTGYGTLITPTQPNQLQQYQLPTQAPNQYPNSGLPVRY